MSKQFDFNFYNNSTQFLSIENCFLKLQSEPRCSSFFEVLINIFSLFPDLFTFLSEKQEDWIDRKTDELKILRFHQLRRCQYFKDLVESLKMDFGGRGRIFNAMKVKEVLRKKQILAQWRKQASARFVQTFKSMI